MQSSHNYPACCAARATAVEEERKKEAEEKKDEEEEEKRRRRRWKISVFRLICSGFTLEESQRGAGTAANRRRDLVFTRSSVGEVVRTFLSFIFPCQRRRYCDCRFQLSSAAFQMMRILNSCSWTAKQNIPKLLFVAMTCNTYST